jgi:hypothetical protein
MCPYPFVREDNAMDEITSIEFEFDFHAWKWISDSVKKGRKAWALRQLESKMAKIITTFNGHRKKNVAKHSPVYRTLLQKAESLISDFCTEYDVPYLTIETQMPALVELKKWGAAAPSASSKIGYVIVYVIVGIIGSVIIVIGLGFATGLIERLFHLGRVLTHW